MYEYTSKDDATKASKEVWEADDYITTLKKITDAEYNDPKAGLAPYTATGKH